MAFQAVLAYANGLEDHPPPSGCNIFRRFSLGSTAGPLIKWFQWRCKIHLPDGNYLVS